MNRIEHRARALKMGVSPAIYDAMNGTMTVNLRVNSVGNWQLALDDAGADLQITSAPSVGDAVIQANKTCIFTPFDSLKTVDFNSLGFGRIVNLYATKA